MTPIDEDTRLHQHYISLDVYQIIPTRVLLHHTNYLSHYSGSIFIAIAIFDYWERSKTANCSQLAMQANCHLFFTHIYSVLIIIFLQRFRLKQTKSHDRNIFRKYHHKHTDHLSSKKYHTNMNTHTLFDDILSVQMQHKPSQNLHLISVKQLHNLLHLVLALIY